jgi:hypothetical protein
MTELWAHRCGDCHLLRYALRRSVCIEYRWLARTPLQSSRQCLAYRIASHSSFASFFARSSAGDMAPRSSKALLCSESNEPPPQQTPSMEFSHGAGPSLPEQGRSRTAMHRCTPTCQSLLTSTPNQRISPATVNHTRQF